MEVFMQEEAASYGNDPPLSQCPEPIAIVGMGKYNFNITF
jgi:hypothetical protein